jgi:Tfp pilus assembly protein PilZ
MKKDSFIERRKEHRLPFASKVIFTDGSHSGTAYAANVSRGGLFLMSLEPYPIDTHCYVMFSLPSHPTSLCFKAKCVHIVFDRQRCEIECGMGFQFLEMNEQQKSLLNLHILNEKSAYQELQGILAKDSPDSTEIARCMKRIPSLHGSDLLELRYRVNRICTIFEPSPDPFAEDQDEKTLIA